MWDEKRMRNEINVERKGSEEGKRAILYCLKVRYFL